MVIYKRLDFDNKYSDSRLKMILDFYYSMDREPETRRECLAHLFELIDNMASDGNFFWIDRFISFLNLKYWSIEFLVGVLTITLSFNEKLKERRSFYQACYSELISRDENAFEALKGLDRRQDQPREPSPIYTIPYPTNQYIPKWS